MTCYIVGEAEFMLTLLWCIPSSIIILSFLYGIPSFYSILRNLKEHIWVRVEVNDDPASAGSIDVAVVIPLYMEDGHSIEETFRSIAKQRYCYGRIDVYVVLEQRDKETFHNVLNSINTLIEKGLSVYLFINSSQRKSKASSINALLKHVREFYQAVVIFDGGDRVLDEHYIEKVAKLVAEGYSVVSAKVYRIGRNVLGKLSYIDTLLWYNVGLPGLAKVIGTPLVSGEGLTLSVSFLNKLNGFPEVLAEDAYLTIFTSCYSEKVALLDSVILEGAPMDLKSLIRQRIRWYRGSLECLRDVVTKHRKRLSKKKLILLIIAYLQPVALTAPFLAAVILMLSPALQIPTITLTLAKIELLSIALAPAYLVLYHKILDPTLLLTPIHWVFQGLLALIALTPVKVTWFRTANRSNITLTKDIASLEF
jgi:cellulose synthase/poly-beta-1,6-N-acetylglucosamine synthase-like glycosyltransferase